MQVLIWSENIEGKMETMDSIHNKLVSMDSRTGTGRKAENYKRKNEPRSTTSSKPTESRDHYLSIQHRLYISTGFA